MELTVKDFDARLRLPFTAMIAGPTGFGKTEVILRMIEVNQTIAHFPPVEIHYCYGVYQNAFDDVSEVIINITSFFRDGQNRWLLIDDLMGKVSGKANANALYTKPSHHLNINIFFIVQNLFLKENRTLSLNSRYSFSSLKTLEMLFQSPIWLDNVFPED